MNKFLMATIAAGVALAGTTAAEARDGCGPGGHRGPYGRCRPNGGPAFVAPGAIVIGQYYPGRGYWDGHRYYQHRERFHGDWRYR